MTATNPFETGQRADSSYSKPLSEGSRFFQRLERRYGDVFASLPQETPTRQVLERAYDQ